MCNKFRKLDSYQCHVCSQRTKSWHCWLSARVEYPKLCCSPPGPSEPCSAGMGHGALESEIYELIKTAHFGFFKPWTQTLGILLT